MKLWADFFFYREQLVEYLLTAKADGESQWSEARRSEEASKAGVLLLKDQFSLPAEAQRQDR